MLCNNERYILKHNFFPALRNIGNIHVRIQSTQNAEQQLMESGVKASYQEDFAMVKHKPKTSSAITVWDLPESVLVYILKGLHVRDLLSFRSV